MGKKKLNERQELEIVNMVKDRVPYEQIVRVISDKYDTKITKMAISKVIKRTVGYLGMETAIVTENQLREQSIGKNLTKVLETVMNMYEKIISDLKEKQESENLDRKDVLTLNSCMDRLMRLRMIMFPAVSVSKEVSFTESAPKKYKVD